MCCVAGVNRTGNDGSKLEYNGHTSAFDCLGVEITSTKENYQGFVIVEFNKTQLLKVRNSFNFLNDKDAFKIT